ncbi:MAG TPA: class I SAM-dependent methyltransferase [Gammaproteobacteria bacterium]|jgi:SAM-dependent methyltransferase
MSEAAELKTLAARADVHELYEEAVQSVDADVEFLHATFRALRGREAHSFREDFCGTASACCEWVRRTPRGFAIGVDHDPAVLDWGRRHRVARLAEKERARVKLLESDVRTVESDRVDIIGAFNFSYFLFETRDELRGYFAHAHSALNADGILCLDAFGGPESISVQKERTKCDGFTYVWDQADYEPVTNHITCHIHFHFPDGSKLKRAFTYEWRMWSLPEIRELLLEAGFVKVRVYWEGTGEDGEGNDEFTESATGEPDAAWVSYIVAEK